LSNWHYCGTKIYWHRINGKPKIFEDKDGTIAHVCNPLTDKKNDHKLITSTITRVSQSESNIGSNQKEITEIKIRLRKLEKL